MGFLRDYLASDFSLIISYALFMAWVMIIAYVHQQKKKKAKNNKSNFLKRSWWFWTVSIILVINVFFTQFNAQWFGISTPDSFIEMKINENEIILFDNKVTYYDDDNTSTDDYSSHLRIHVVDRYTHEKRYEDLIGTNYFTFIDSNEIFILEYTGYSDGFLKEVFTYDISSKEMSSVVEQGEIYDCEGKSFEAYEIEASLGIVITSKDGKKFTYNSITQRFQKFEGEYLYPRPNKFKYDSGPFYVIPEQTGSERRVLKVGDYESKYAFIKPQIIGSCSRNNQSYVLIESYEDLTEENIIYSFCNDQAKLMWEINMEDFEDAISARGFEKIQQFETEDDVIYLTINAYLFELDFNTGNTNWWLKL